MKLFTPEVIAPDIGIARRLAWVTGLRLVFLSALLAGTTFLYLGQSVSTSSFSVRIVMGAIAAAFALAAVYAAVLRSGRRLLDLAYAQLALDQITWTAIVYVSGGATSGATSFYALTCLVGAILIGRRGAFIAAATGILIYASLCAGFALGWVKPPSDQSPFVYAIHANTLVYPLLVNTLGILVVASLAGYLAERLRLTGGALEEARQRAEDAERLAVLGRVAAGLAHEIRNPLGSISGSIEMLRESTALSEEDKQLCDIIHREAERLNQLVTDMMDLSKPMAPTPDNVDVANVAREVVALAGRSERSGAGDVKVSYDGPAGSLTARCDGAQMRQVMWNLVRNAVQASPAGQTVHVRVRTIGDDVELSVEDRGPGITLATRERMFDDFFTTRTQGAGMGLAVVKRIIDDHKPYGARINVDRAEGGGARFSVALKARA